MRSSFGFATIILFLLFSLNFAQKTLGQSMVEATDQNFIYPLGHLVEILEDKTQKMTIKEVLSQENNQKFKLSTQKHPNQSYSTANYWFRIRISQKGLVSLDKKLFIQLQNPNIDTVEVFFLSLDQKIFWQYKTGDMYPFSQRFVPFSKFLFPFPDKNKVSTFDIYLKFSGYYAKRHDLMITDDHTILEEAQYKLGAAIFTIAILLGLAIYNLLLYLMVRDNAYFYYVMYLFGVFFYLSATSGVGFQFIYPNVPQITHLVGNEGVVFALMSVGLFAHYFLKVEEIIKKNYYIYKIIGIGSLIFGFFLNISVPIIAFFSPYFLSLAFQSTSLYALVMVVLILTLGIIGLISGSRQAKFFMSAWGLLMLGTSIHIFQLLGVPFSGEFSENFLRLGIISEAFLLSFALSDKIRANEHEKRKAQAENLKLITEQKEILEQKVAERTQQLVESNEELNQTNEELGITLEVVNKQKNEIELINKNVTDSIHYAQRIQSSMLPSYQEIYQHLPENFILFKPRDIISGDFYYFQEKNDKIIISAIDCTGHGVPGALMTMVANESLNEIILNNEVFEADKILNALHKNIRKALKQAETNNKDGMDLVLLVIDKKNKTAEFAGAKNPLLYVQNNTIHQIKGDKMPIGGEQKEKERIFTKHIIDITQETTFYLFTDGFTDQFGGKEKKKFLISNFRTLLLQISTQNPNAQKQTLEKTFANWMYEGNEKQIDDVLVMGVKL